MNLNHSLTFDAALLYNLSFDNFILMAFESDPSTSAQHPFSATSLVSLTHLGVTSAALLPG